MIDWCIYIIWGSGSRYCGVLSQPQLCFSEVCISEAVMDLKKLLMNCFVFFQIKLLLRTLWRLACLRTPYECTVGRCHFFCRLVLWKDNSFASLVNLWAWANRIWSIVQHRMVMKGVEEVWWIRRLSTSKIMAESMTKLLIHMKIRWKIQFFSNSKLFIRFVRDANDILYIRSGHVFILL